MSSKKEFMFFHYALMYSIQLGWRWMDGQLCFSSEWRNEELETGMTGLDKTIQVLKMMINSICDFLNLTMESAVDF